LAEAADLLGGTLGVGRLVVEGELPLSAAVPLATMARKRETATTRRIIFAVGKGDFSMA